MINDKILSFLHELALHNEAERYLTKQEQMESIRDLYCDMQYCMSHSERSENAEELMVRLFPYPDKNDVELLAKFKDFFKEDEDHTCLYEEIPAMFEKALEEQADELDFYSDLLDMGITVEIVEKYLGTEQAEHMKIFCMEHGLLNEEEKEG